MHSRSLFVLPTPTWAPAETAAACEEAEASVVSLRSARCSGRSWLRWRGGSAAHARCLTNAGASSARPPKGEVACGARWALGKGSFEHAEQSWHLCRRVRRNAHGDALEGVRYLAPGVAPGSREHDQRRPAVSGVRPTPDALASFEAIEHAGERRGSLPSGVAQLAHGRLLGVGKACEHVNFSC